VPASSHIGPNPSKVSRERNNNPRQYRKANVSSSGRWLFNDYHADCLLPLHEDMKEYSRICTTNTRLNPFFLGHEITEKKIQRVCSHRCTLGVRHKPSKGSEPRSARVGTKFNFPTNIHTLLIKIQLDATVCRYLFNAKVLYMFRVSQQPSSEVLKTVTAASGTGHNIGYSFFPSTCSDRDTLVGSRCISTGSSKKMDGIWNRYNFKSTRRIYTFGVLKCSEKFKVLDLP